MISVGIFINGQLIAEKNAHRIEEPDKDGLATYETDCKVKIKHNPQKGAVPLAKKMLDCLDIEPSFFDLPKEEQYRRIHTEIEKRQEKIK